MKTSKNILCLMLFLLSHTVFCQTADTLRSGKIITNAQMVAVGGAEFLDTYLSQEKYTGTELRYISHTIREHSGRRWSRLIVHQGSFAWADNRANNGDEIAGSYQFAYGARRLWTFLGGRLRLMAGAEGDVHAGFLYNTRNSNNPAQAQLWLNVSPSASLSYRFKLWNRPCLVAYEASVPLLGVMFSPNYGQSYYEIFSEGNYDHNIVLTSVVNAPSLRQILSLDMTLGKTTLRVGYLGDFRQSKVNDLKYHCYSNMLMLGIVRHFSIIKIQP